MGNTGVRNTGYDIRVDGVSRCARCAAGREVYFKGEEKMLLRVVDSIFASGYLTAGGQGIRDTIQAIEAAGFTYEIESD